MSYKVNYVKVSELLTRVELAGDEFLVPWKRIETLKHRWPRPLVLVNGAFDLMHDGHALLIRVARDYAGPNGTVVCAIDSDSKVRACKGVNRPVQTWLKRWRNVSYHPVDFVCEIRTDAEFLEMCSRLRPNVRVQSDEKRERLSRIPHIPVIQVPRIEGGSSTSNIIKSIKENEND